MWLAQAHAASKCQIQNGDPSLSASKGHVPTTQNKTKLILCTRDMIKMELL